MRLYTKLFLLSLFVFLLFNALHAGPDNLKVFKDFTLKDYNGAVYSLSDFEKSNAIVVIFMATHCPISNAYNERMAKIHMDYKDKDVTLIGINSNKQEDVNEMKEHASENGLDFIILKDYNNVVADQFDASSTPEVYVLNPKLELLYHGRIDDSREAGKVEKKDLKVALDEILTGTEVSVKETKAFGCSIKRVKK